MCSSTFFVSLFKIFRPVAHSLWVKKYIVETCNACKSKQRTTKKELKRLLFGSESNHFNNWFAAHLHSNKIGLKFERLLDWGCKSQFFDFFQWSVGSLSYFQTFGFQKINKKNILKNFMAHYKKD